MFYIDFSKLEKAHCLIYKIIFDFIYKDFLIKINIQEYDISCILLISQFIKKMDLIVILASVSAN
jgi:hypothetical protein